MNPLLAGACLGWWILHCRLSPSAVRLKWMSCLNGFPLGINGVYGKQDVNTLNGFVCRVLLSQDVAETRGAAKGGIARGPEVPQKRGKMLSK